MLCLDSSGDGRRDDTANNGRTWQEMFPLKSGRRHNPTVSLEISGNTATVKWRPRFIVYERLGILGKAKLEPCSPKLEACMRPAIEGALRWASDVFPNPSPLTIRGVEGRFVVEVYDRNGKLYCPGDRLADYDFSPAGHSRANVSIFIERRDSAIVWDAFMWRPWKRLNINISVNKQDNEALSCFSRIAEHEFGHVLGLFDAYGYSKKSDPCDGSFHYGGHPWPSGLLPPSFIDGTRLLKNSVMVCDYLAAHEAGCGNRIFARTSLDYEMILLAFSEERLQLYSDCVLGRRSRALSGS